MNPTAPRTLVGTILGLAVAALLAWRLGGTTGAGVVAGYLLGASMTGLGSLYQRHVLRTRPQRLMSTTVALFVAKLAAVLLFGLAFRFVDPLAAAVDWRGFLIAFAGAAVILLPLGAWDAMRATTREGTA